MLAGFDNAFKNFERDAYSLLHEYRFDPGSELPSLKIQIQAQNLATDIGYFAMAMRDLHEAAIHEISEEMDRDNAEYQAYQTKKMDESTGGVVLNEEFFKNQPRRDRRISVALAKLGAAIKVFLSPVRAYQDLIYRIALCISGESAGPRSSMKAAVNRQDLSFNVSNPVGDESSGGIAGWKRAGICNMVHLLTLEEKLYKVRSRN